MLKGHTLHVPLMFLRMKWSSRIKRNWNSIMRRAGYNYGRDLGRIQLADLHSIFGGNPRLHKHSRWIWGNSPGAFGRFRTVFRRCSHEDAPGTEEMCQVLLMGAVFSRAADGCAYGFWVHRRMVSASRTASCHSLSVHASQSSRTRTLQVSQCWFFASGIEEVVIYCSFFSSWCHCIATWQVWLKTIQAYVQHMIRSWNKHW